MKQQIGTMKPITEPITDIDVVFVALYNLLYEKLQTEPNKGIVVSKGNANQRKATWKEVMHLAHSLEDYFSLREIGTRRKSCYKCKNWKSTSEASPHLGLCKSKNISMHKFGSCADIKEYDQ